MLVFTDPPVTVSLFTGFSNHSLLLSYSWSKLQSSPKQTPFPSNSIHFYSNAGGNTFAHHSVDLRICSLGRSFTFTSQIRLLQVGNKRSPHEQNVSENFVPCKAECLLSSAPNGETLLKQTPATSALPLYFISIFPLVFLFVNFKRKPRLGSLARLQFYSTQLYAHSVTFIILFPLINLVSALEKPAKFWCF